MHSFFAGDNRVYPNVIVKCTNVILKIISYIVLEFGNFAITKIGAFELPSTRKEEIL